MVKALETDNVKNILNMAKKFVITIRNENPKYNPKHRIKAFDNETEMLSYIDDIGSYIYGN